MPTQQRRGPDEKRRPPDARQQPARRREEQSVRRPKHSSPDLTAQDGQLVAQLDDLQFLELRRPEQEGAKLQNASNGDVSKPTEARRLLTRKAPLFYADRIGAPHRLKELGTRAKGLGGGGPGDRVLHFPTADAIGVEEK